MTATIADSFTLPCGTTLKNRLSKAAMTEGLADERNRATDRHETLYRRWAHGGAGMLLTGNVQVDKRYLERAGNVVIDGPQSNEQMQRLSAFAEAGRANDTHIWMQISHAGRQTPKAVASEPVGPSEVALALPGGRFGKPRALADDEIRDIIQRFAFVASTAKDAGFTGVQIHAAHGYLLSEFLSPRVNQREDIWGGSLENRARFLLETVRATRTAVGPDFPVSIKLNSADFQKRGFSLEDCLQVVEMLNNEGVDLLEISGGTYEQPKLVGIDGMEPAENPEAAASTRAREAYFIDYAITVRSVAKMPLMVTGGLRTVRGMNEALAGGEIDVLGIGRPFCVDPDFANHILSGEVAEAEDVEAGLQLGPWLLSKTSPLKAMRAINGFAKMGWYYEQIYRLADGLDADTKMSAFTALRRYEATEAKKAKELIRE